MGCGSSQTVKDNDSTSRTALEKTSSEKSVSSSSSKKYIEYNLNKLKDQNIRSYLYLIQKGLISLEFMEFEKMRNLKNFELVNLKENSLIPIVIKDPTHIQKFLNSADKIIKLKENLKSNFKTCELGIYYSDILVPFLIIPKTYPSYYEDVYNLLSTNANKFLKIELNDGIPFMLLLKIINAIKNNKLIKTLNITSIIDDMILKLIFTNLIINNSITKINLSKLGINEEIINSESFCNKIRK
jgi:hypothetical protein